MVLRRRRKSDIPRAGPFPPGWDVPARFNFTRDVVEALGAGDSLRKGVAYVDREGIVDRRTFSDVAKDAARWAHLLRTRLDRGDRVLIVLGKVPAWHGAMLGALKGGLIAVPCSDMLRARDLAHRVRDSGARLVVADRSCEAEVEEMLEPGGRRRRRRLPRRGPDRAPALRPARTDRGDDGRRQRAHPLHVGDDERAQGRRPHARLHLGAARPGRPLARRARAGRRLVHGGHRMGEVDLERAPRSVVARGRGGRPRGRVRPGAAPVAHGAARRHRAVPGPDRVPHAREAR